ncbi:flavodoxin domain-containing protein [Luteolibacter sp. SL250]|uniref:flavodoxin domain-containing protein n=1 Tax=Luteolibacter sp. SL250 TaxID=2995170 RepID=UPI00226DD1A2|nr:flavodoxin domain-containing protein [Luteolibacter sp. SL250]WAC19933.1 flavodoxin domain-containing protein [Luteolibacter sp. SL250]
MLVLFATMTGNAEDAAENIAKRLRKSGHDVSVANIEKHTPQSLPARGEPVLFVVSTWGDGEPPDEAIDFFGDLEGLASGDLDGLLYSVYALGDSGYDEFCGFGRKLDAGLEAKGAVRIAARAEADIDYEEFIEDWTNDVHAALEDQFAA